MSITHIKSSEFAAWFTRSKPGDAITYFSGPSLTVACEEDHAIEKLRDEICKLGFDAVPRQDGNSIRLVDRGEMHLVQRRIGQKPEGNAAGAFEYIAIKSGRGS
jgi:hypothetical protein